MNKSKRHEPQSYKSSNGSEYNAALQARGYLCVWLDPKMHWYAPKTGRSCRPQIFSDSAIQFCLTIKCLFGLPLRQTLGLVKSLLKLAQLDWEVPDISTLCRRQKSLTVNLPYRASKGALTLLVDSTGIQFLRRKRMETEKAWSRLQAPMPQSASGR